MPNKDAIKQKLLSNKKLREMAYADAALKLGVSPATVYRWRAEAGFGTPKDQARKTTTKAEREAGRARMHADPDYYTGDDGRSTRSLPDLGEKYGISTHQAKRVLIERGLKVSVSQDHNEFQDFRPAIDGDSAKVCRLMNRWSR
jgi:hypothetical protein